MPPETFLTILQVADCLDLSPESVARLIQREKIKAVHTQASGQVRISSQELASFIAEQEEGVKRFLEEGGQATFNELSQSFHEQIGCSHEDWLRGGRIMSFLIQLRTCAWPFVPRLSASGPSNNTWERKGRGNNRNELSR